MRLIGMGIGHLSSGNATRVPNEVLESAYKYSTDLESDDEADNCGDTQEGLRNAGDDANSSDEETAGGYMDDGEEGTMMTSPDVV